ncbi:MAG: HPr-rel-A system PqqD family peptide chaperone [Sphingomonadales bacterium]|nr:HPr-rel-A system PqqD family peptide chaperone [Sphingomonadales bacterium]
MTPPTDRPSDTPVSYRAAAPGATIVTPLDSLYALYDRRSGLTQLVAQPVPAILSALAEGVATPGELQARLERDFAVEGEAGALAARLDELVALGLIERL